MSDLHEMFLLGLMLGIGSASIVWIFLFTSFRRKP